jgi:hypothetical protein
MSKRKKNEQLHSLIPLEDFKALMGVDSREDKTAVFCLLTATLSIEQYCMRTLLRKKKTDVLELQGDKLVILREYPVSEILAVYGIINEKLAISNEQRKEKRERFIEPYFFRPMLGNDYNCEMPFELLLSNSLKHYQFVAVKVIYWSGYKADDVPADLASACMELAAWNMNRYRGRRIGMTGNIKGAGIQGEHFEMSMPENVRKLLEPYRRKTI